MKGIGVSSGIAIGKALIKQNTKIEVVKRNIDDSKEEIKRLNDAREKGKVQIEALYQRMLEKADEETANIFQAHKMILDDPDFFGEIEDIIKTQSVNAEWAVKEITDKFVDIFDNMEDPLIKERAADIKDVSSRLMSILLGIKSVDFTNLDEEVIVVANDLTPSDTAQMDKDKVLGFVTEVGGRTSHSAIMARTLEIPAIVGVEGIREKVSDGEYIALDGETGEIYISPDKETINEFKKRKKKEEELKVHLKELKGLESITKDGHLVELVSNIGSPKDVDGVIENGGEGVGLYRTEFLYMDRNSLPTEDEQYEAYKDVAVRLANKPVVIRTLDIGGDKDLPYLNLPKEDNPFLGYRAIRLCLDRTDVFITQLRALLRASAYGDIRIMFPMISSIDELREAKQILEDAKTELIDEGIAFNKDIQVGIMVEVPSVAVMSDVFAKEVDFFSIGTNDLLQYTVAVDRGNSNISNLYNQFHPALLRLIKTTIDNAHNEGIKVAMCGEAAGDPRLIPIFLGMGLDEFSMSSSSILRARWTVKNTSKSDMEKRIDEIIALPTAKDVEEYISK